MSSLLTLHLEKASARLGGPTRGWVDQQQVAFLILRIDRGSRCASRYTYIHLRILMSGLRSYRGFNKT